MDDDDGDDGNEDCIRIECSLTMSSVESACCSIDSLRSCGGIFPSFEERPVAVVG